MTHRHGKWAGLPVVAGENRGAQWISAMPDVPPRYQMPATQLCQSALCRSLQYGLVLGEFDFCGTVVGA